MSTVEQIVQTLLEGEELDAKDLAMRTPPVRLNYVISGHQEDDELLFWSNRYGWTGLIGATRFKARDIENPARYPIGWTGVWELIHGKLGEQIKTPVQESEEPPFDAKAEIARMGVFPHPVIRTSFSKTRFHDDGSGDYDEEHGWIDQDGEEFSIDEIDQADGVSVAGKAADWLKSQDCLEPSSSHFHTGVWYTSTNDNTNADGWTTQRSYHLKGFTPEEEAKIFNFIVRPRRVLDSNDR